MDTPNTAETPGQWVKIHQQKSNLFRVVHADGVWMSVNPHRQIHLTFYSERYPIPTAIFFGVDGKGTVIDEDISRRETKKDWVREMEVSVSLSLETARAVQTALDRFIKIAEGKSA